MRVLIQRADEVFIRINNEIHCTSGRGLLLFIGVGSDDSESLIPYFADKIINLRIFEDSDGKMNLSIKDINGEITAVSQFTLYADTSRGRRPGFSLSATPEKAKALYCSLLKELKKTGLEVKEGVFGAHMKIGLINDGPATFLIEKN